MAQRGTAGCRVTRCKLARRGGGLVKRGAAAHIPAERRARGGRVQGSWALGSWAQSILITC